MEGSITAPEGSLKPGLEAQAAQGPAWLDIPPGMGWWPITATLDFAKVSARETGAALRSMHGDWEADGVWCEDPWTKQTGLSGQRLSQGQSLCFLSVCAALWPQQVPALSDLGVP